MASKDYGANRFSGLDQINTGNVGNLRLAWTFSTGVLRGHEAAPLVVDGTMFFVTPYPNILYAIDAVTGEKKWEYKPKPASASQGVACCDVVNRGAAYWEGKVIYNTLDAHTVAVDALTGKEVWKTRLGDINRGETMTMAPIVVKGKVLVGNSGGEFGVRGWLIAVNASDGEVAWRAYSTGPDADVLIGPRFKPFYSQDQGTDLGVTSWPRDHWKIGGGTVWGWISYDPELNLIYHGTGNPGPWNPEVRPGDNKWTAGVFARDPDTGEAIWAYQWSPHDLYDYDGVNENVLLDLPINGQTRNVLVRPERNGYVYVMDRATGEVLSADQYVYTTVTKGIDLKTGKMIEDESKATGYGRIAREICPSAPGGKDWQPSSWSPRTRILYIPHNNLCMDMEGLEANYIAGTPYVGASVKMYAGPGGHRGEFTAWDPVQKKKIWSIKEKFPAWSGALATAGDVVFYGTMDRNFKAVDARSGDLLWQYRTGLRHHQSAHQLQGTGREAIYCSSGWSWRVGRGDCCGRTGPQRRDVCAGLRRSHEGPAEHTNQGGTIYVFTLP